MSVAQFHGINAPIDRRSGGDFGLITEDFDLVRDGETHMKKIAEASRWPKTIHEVYQLFEQALRKQTLLAGAKRMNGQY